MKLHTVNWVFYVAYAHDFAIVNGFSGNLQGKLEWILVRLQANGTLLR